MSLRTHEPESCASANSAIPAYAFSGEEKDFGGQGWIRTTEVCDGRFTVCSLWPLGNLPMFVTISSSQEEKVEPVKGLEPPTC